MRTSTISMPSRSRSESCSSPREGFAPGGRQQLQAVIETSHGLDGPRSLELQATLRGLVVDGDDASEAFDEDELGLIHEHDHRGQQCDHDETRQPSGDARATLGDGRAVGGTGGEGHGEFRGQVFEMSSAKT